MTWEYKIIEATDYGHPGGTPRYQEFLNELSALSKEGWEVDQLVPTLQRGRTDTTGQEFGGKGYSSLTAVALLALLKRKIE